MITKPRKQTAGFDCFPEHEYPPKTLCNGPLCMEWQKNHSIQRACDSGHAHMDHYWNIWDSKVMMYHCPGRQYCDPTFMEPS
jgi:hypothetical protein